LDRLTGHRLLTPERLLVSLAKKIEGPFCARTILHSETLKINKIKVTFKEETEQKLSQTKNKKNRTGWTRTVGHWW
jgi:hypothetical protein